MEGLDNEFGDDLWSDGGDIVSDQIGDDRLGFNLGPFEEDEDDRMVDISTGQMVRELLMRHPEAMIMVVPPKTDRYSFFVSNVSENKRFVPLAGEAIKGWSHYLGMEFEYDIEWGT